MPDSEHPWREDLEILRQKHSPLYDQIGALASELNKARDKNKALKGWICALCALILLILVFWRTDRTENVSTPDYSFTSEEYEALLSQVRSLEHTEGYEEGYNAGKIDVSESLWGDGYDSGYDAGYIDGSKYLETIASTEDAKETDTSSYDTGYSEGYASGYADGASSVSLTANGETGVSEISSASNATSEPQLVDTPSTTAPTCDYIINTNTGKFHYPWCSSVGKMNESNKWYYTGTHDDVVNMGYVPCQRCCP